MKLSNVRRLASRFAAVTRPVVGCLLLASAFWPGRASAVVPWTININTNNVVTVTNAPFYASTTTNDNTVAIQKAIDSAATTNGGCTVRIPPGIFLCGPLTMKSGINLQVDAGAILRMLPFGMFPGSSNANGA